jgi:hypothetical protein
MPLAAQYKIVGTSEEIFVSSLDEGIALARALREAYPAYGVQIESENGIQIWDSEEGFLE